MTWLALLLAATPVAADHVEVGALVTIPHVALRLSDREPLGAAISVPWTLKLVAASPRPFLHHWLLVEPGVVIAKEVAFRGRFGFRLTGELTSWLNVGAGFGVSIDVPTAGVAIAPSPEVMVRVGSGPTGYGVAFARLEPQLDHSVVGYVGVGYAFW
ncbi:MAG: hypothetical protein DI536_20885 [Archangium gephyra]|uniref:Uncharacterized protein n=1 Tax=Archangium gephyra TaxID=48 RepID=A0A2W5T351_9BACT|nr:MAG: hypothetical protein DI536_20885 [Archangium gephyra]